MPAPGEADYEAICAAVMETERGRWFLDQYARRNRQCDTAQVLAAIDRLEALARQNRLAPAPQAVAPSPAGAAGADIERLRSELAAMANAIAHTKTEIAALKPDVEPSGRIMEATEQLDNVVKTTERATSDILTAAEQVQEVAWTMREQGMESDFCDRLDGYATEIYTACSFQDLTGQRTRKIIHVLRYLEARLEAMMDIWGPRQPAAHRIDTSAADLVQDEIDHVLTPDAAANDVAFAAPADTLSAAAVPFVTPPVVTPPVIAPPVIAPPVVASPAVAPAPSAPAVVPPVVTPAAAAPAIIAPAVAVPEVTAPAAAPTAVAAPPMVAPPETAPQRNDAALRSAAPTAPVEPEPSPLVAEGPPGSFSILGAPRSRPPAAPPESRLSDADDVAAFTSDLAADLAKLMPAMSARTAAPSTEVPLPAPRHDGTKPHVDSVAAALGLPENAAPAPVAMPAMAAPPSAVLTPSVAVTPAPLPERPDHVLPLTPAPRLADLPFATIAPPPRATDIAADLFADVMALSEEERIALFT